MGGYGGWRGQNSVNVGDRKGGGGWRQNSSKRGKLVE